MCSTKMMLILKVFHPNSGGIKIDAQLNASTAQILQFLCIFPSTVPSRITQLIYVKNKSFVSHFVCYILYIKALIHIHMNFNTKHGNLYTKLYCIFQIVIWLHSGNVISTIKSTHIHIY